MHAPALPPDAGGAGLPGRILIVSDAWAPQVNGVVRSYENIARVLCGQGRVVKVIGPADFVTLPLPGYPGIPLALAPRRRLAAMIEAFAPHAVHVAVEGPLGWAARRHCLRRGRPFSTAFHTNFPAYAALRAPRPLGGAVARGAAAVARRFHAPARLTHVATPSVEAQLRDWGFAGRFARLSHGVDCGLFHPGARRPRGDVPVLLHVGRIAPEKNIEAFLALSESETGPVRKVVVGDGPQLPALRQRYRDVSFRGLLTGAALAQAYRSADVFVFPSRTDTFGLVLIEALASGLPIAAHDVPGPRDIVTDPCLGALDADLGRAIRRALAAPGSPRARHAHVRDRYSWDAVAATFLAHCAEVRG
ncbi:glycosyltransferase [Rhodobaculum claviforme]|uniref:glycosyltransferase n=1 Tax=Rhodobaculum claviforme TaxID=1549854 RepID=UPI001912F286